jgi:hypothetical protein
MNINTILETGPESLLRDTSATCKLDILMHKAIIHIGLSLEIYYKTSFKNI